MSFRERHFALRSGFWRIIHNAFRHALILGGVREMLTYTLHLLAPDGDVKKCEMV